MLQRPEHHVRDFFSGMSPDIDDLIIALTVSDDSAAVLLFYQRDLLVGLIELGLLLVRE